MAEKVALLETFCSKDLSLVREKGIQTVISNKIDLDRDDIPHDIKVIYAPLDNFDRTSWVIYDQGKKWVSGIKKVKKEFLFYQDFNLESAFQKMLLWSLNRGEGSLKANYDLMQGEENVSIAFSRYPKLNPVKQYVKSLFDWIKSFKDSPAKPSPEVFQKRYPFVFLIDSLILLKFWKNLIEEFHPDRTLLVLMGSKKQSEGILGAELTKEFAAKGYRFEGVDWKENVRDKRSRFPFWRLNAQQSMALNLLQAVKPQMEVYIEAIKHIVSAFDPDVLITNAGENTWRGHVLSEMKNHLPFHVVNTMNGGKDGGANDADTDFSAWIIWDKVLRQLLHTKAAIPLDQLCLGKGHLMEDEIRAFSSKELLSLSQKAQKYMIISYCSTPGLSFRKVEALEMLYELMAQEDIFLLYRPHPSEKISDYYLPKSPSLNDRVQVVSYDQNTNKDTLYEQFIYSDLIIVSGSTVGLEAYWAGVPAITYEDKEKSSIHLVDNELLFHVKDIGDLKLATTNMLGKRDQFAQRKVIGMPGSRNQIAQSYADIIMSFSVEKERVTLGPINHQP